MRHGRQYPTICARRSFARLKPIRRRAGVRYWPPVSGVQAQRQPVEIRGAKLRAPQPTGAAGAGRVPRGQRPICRRHRQWRLADLRRDFLGAPAHLYMQKNGPGLYDITDPIVELFIAETGQLMAWTKLSCGRTARPGFTARNKAHCARNRTAYPQACSRAERLLVDGI